MKRATLPTVLILTIFVTYAQDKLLGILPLKEGKVTYTDVVQVDSVSKRGIIQES